MIHASHYFLLLLLFSTELMEKKIEEKIQRQEMLGRMEEDFMQMVPAPASARAALRMMRQSISSAPW